MGDQYASEDTKFPDNDELVPYVTAGNLSQRNGAKVTLWGKVTKVSASDGFYVKTVDDHEILIKLKRPLSEALEGWYEICGVSQGKSVLCDEYIPLPTEITNNVDLEGHKALSKFLAALDDPWTIDDGATGDTQGIVPM